MKPGATRERVRCRLINDDDLLAIAELLGKGFGGYSSTAWSRRLDLLKHRNVPDGIPQYGYCLDAGGRLVGVILLISSIRRIGEEDAVFSNVGSWYVEEDYRAYAQLLVSMALRKKDVTYLNVTPAPHTWPIVENQGYTRYCNGLFFAAAALKRPQPGVGIAPFDEQSHRNVPDYDLLRRHAELGCTVLVACENGQYTGYVFRRYCIRAGKLPLPAMLVIHGPDQKQLVRLAGNLGRHFLRRAAPFLVIDADGPVAGLLGVYTEARGRKYFRGPHRPGLCDLSDTELAIFGV